MTANPYARGEHDALLLGYLETVERRAAAVKTIEDWQMLSVDLLDNCKAAIALLKCRMEPAPWPEKGTGAIVLNPSMQKDPTTQGCAKEPPHDDSTAGQIVQGKI